MSHSRGGHWLLRQLVKPGASTFRKAGNRLEQVQREKLVELLSLVAHTPLGQGKGLQADWSWEAFAERVPVSAYPDWAQAISQGMKTGAAGLIESPLVRFQPTSGSSDAIKWIPYTRRFLAELDSALSPWLHDLYGSYPGTRSGYHYWSLSWLPTDMRKLSGESLNDDMQLLSAGKRWLAAQTQAVPDAVSLAPTSEDSLFATIAILAARSDLTAISVWSPTFALGLLENLSLWREELVDVLGKGCWGGRGSSLAQIPAPRNPAAAAMLRAWNGQPAPAFYRELWPRLALVSAWDTAAAQPWAQKLRNALPHAAFQGKGLWATEGVVTIPFQHTLGGEKSTAHVLAANSHVYEFVDDSTGDILPPWALEPGQTVSPLLTTGAGLLRYRLGDQLQVTGHYHQLPILEFLGRGGSTDMVGEKISVIVAQQLLDGIAWPEGVNPVVVLAASEPAPGARSVYALVAEATPQHTPAACERIGTELAEALEQALQAHFHYRLARNLGQLDAARCLCSPTASRDYLQACQDRGMIQGNIKVEALRAWSGGLPGCPVADGV